MRAPGDEGQRCESREVGGILAQPNLERISGRGGHDHLPSILPTCHAQPFVKRVFLATDLGVYQFNEFFKVLAKMRER